MSLVDYAQKELSRAGLFDEDSDYGGMLGGACLAIIEIFASQGHSGLSASITTEIVGKLMRFEPLTPLTSDPSEWMLVDEDGDAKTWQSLRKPSAFSHDGGATWYDIDAPEVAP